MNIAEFRAFCLSLPGVSETMPFTQIADVRSRETICLCVGKKWFCFFNPLMLDFCCLKCDPAKAASLPNEYEGITPGWHMNKKHWISVYFQSDVPDALFRSLLREGYGLVLSSLPKKEQALIRTLPLPAPAAPASPGSPAPAPPAPDWTPPHRKA